MELKAKLVSRWAASILDCLKHLHPTPKKAGQKKIGRQRETERERERREREEREREREKERRRGR